MLLTCTKSFSTVRSIKREGADDVQHGSLRQDVLWIVRQIGRCSASCVCARLRETRPISLNAVQTVLNRLVQEGLLVRQGQRRHYVYEVSPSEAIVKARAEQAARDLLLQSGDGGLAHFLNALDEIEPEALDQLERLLKERRAKE